MDANISNAYEELRQAFKNLTIDDKRAVIVTMLFKITDVLNKVKPSSSLDIKRPSNLSEDEYLCYLHDIINDLEHKLGYLLKSEWKNSLVLF